MLDTVKLRLAFVESTVPFSDQLEKLYPAFGLAVTVTNVPLA